MKTTRIIKSVCAQCHQLYAVATEGFDDLCEVCVEAKITQPTPPQPDNEDAQEILRALNQKQP